MNRFYHEVIEPSVERIPVLQVMHTEHHNGRAHRLTQTISRNVYTEFDRKLSRHLAAVSGAGFPAYAVTVEVADAGQQGGQTGGQAGAKAAESNRLAVAFHDSVPHALLELAGRTFKRCGPVELTFRRAGAQAGGKDGGREGVVHRRRIAAPELDMLRAALAICAELGESEFLNISGDFGIVMVRPPRGLNAVVMHLRNGTLAVPSTAEGDSAPFQWPIYAFAEHASSNIAAQSYLATVSHAIVAEKEAAILEFRQTVERRILDFHAARAGRPLDGHWRQAAAGLIARLQAGLGDGLTGLAEDARGISLDLAGSVAATGGRRAAGHDAAAEALLRPRAIG